MLHRTAEPTRRAFALDTRCETPDAGGRVELQLPDGWLATHLFGGMAMACAARAATHADTAASGARRTPLAVSAVFHRPLSPGPIGAEIRDLGRSRRTACLMVRLGDRATVTTTLVDSSESGDFSQAEGDVVSASRFPDPPAPERLRPLPAAGGRGAAALERQVDWRAVTGWDDGHPADGQPLLAWLRPRRVPWTRDGRLDPLWYLIACDLLGPALYRRSAGEPFAIATVSLDVQILRATRSAWLLQRVSADLDGPWAAGRVELWDRAGRLVATAAQRARLLPAGPAELPWSVTAFGSGRCRLIPV